MVLSSTAEELGSLEEKLLSGLVWDETEFEREGLISIQIHPTDPTKTTKVGALLLKHVQENFKVFLQKNVSDFAWLHEDMSKH